MFNLVANTGILPARVGKTTREVVQRDRQAGPAERFHAGIMAEQSEDAITTSAMQTSSHAERAEEARALSMLYEQYKKPIHSYIYRLLGNLEDADDITQEVFVRACTSWNGLYERDNLSSWLYRIATNLCVDVMRRRKRISWRSLAAQNGQNDRFGSAGEDGSYLLPDSGGIPEIAERDHIRQALAGIPEEYAVVLVLSAAQGIPYQEIAAVLGISPNAAATRISRAKRMFAQQYLRISQEGVEKQEHTL